MNDNIKKILGHAIETPLEYWQFYWRRLVHKFRDNDFELFPLKSSHFLLDMILSEINYHGLKNTQNCKLFQECLGCCLKEDVAFKNLFGIKANLIINNILNKNKTQYVNSICNEIKAGFENGDYFKSLLEWTSNTIKQTQTLDKASRKKINYCTFLIVAEFVANGYSPEDIDSLSVSYPGVIQQDTGHVIHAKESILGISINEFPNEKAFYSKIEELISNLDIDDWLEVIRHAFFETAESALFIVRLNGLKGNFEYSISGATIYNPSSKNYIKYEENRKHYPIEQVSPERDYLNIALPINYKDHFFHTAKEQAFNKLTNLIDLINIHFIKYNITFDENNYVIVKEGFPFAGNMFGSSKQSNDFIEYISAKDVSSSEEDFSLILKRYNAMHSRNVLSDTRLINALHWLNKGLKVSSYEDKLLYNWIALESILNVDSTFKANICQGNYTTLDYIIRSVKAVTYCCYYTTPLYSYYDYLLMTVNDHNNYFDLPEQLIIDAALNIKAGDKYQLKKFFDHFKQIINNINDVVFKNELERVDNFYTIEGFNKFEKSLTRNLTLIYRFRNLIAHNATFPQYIIKYYAEDIERITLRVVRKLVDVYRKDENSLEDVILKCIIKYDIFKSDIKSNICKFIVDF